MPSPFARPPALAVAALLFASQVVKAEEPYSLDKNSPIYRRPVAGYIPTVAPAVIFTVLFGIHAVITWIHFSHRKILPWLAIGHTAMAVGFALRIAGHFKPFDIPLYSVSQICILLAPCAYLATAYQLLGKMANSLGRDTVAVNCLLLRTSLITKIFVTSDIVTFLIQASGSGIQASGNETTKIGHDLAMAGLIIQLVSFGLYCCLLAVFGFRVRKMYPDLWYRTDGLFTWSPRAIFSRGHCDEWKVVFHSTIFACVGLLIRCIFRVVEYSQGFDGAIATNEAYVYCLDSLPLFIGVGVYSWFTPGRYMALNVSNNSSGAEEEVGTPMEESTTRKY